MGWLFQRALPRRAPPRQRYKPNRRTTFMRKIARPVGRLICVFLPGGQVIWSAEVAGGGCYQTFWRGMTDVLMVTTWLPVDSE